MVAILAHKHCDRPSVFTPEGLLREARRQKVVPQGHVPEICLLDPDGNDAMAGLIAQVARAWKNTR